MDKSIPAAAGYILESIGDIEAPDHPPFTGYDVVYANRMDKMPKPLTSMTVQEAIKDGPRRSKLRTKNRKGSSACGRYQFMEATLKSLIAEGVSPNMVMTKNNQDILGFRLLRRRKYDQWVAGTIGDGQFALQLAMEWASFPVLDNRKGAHQAVSRGDTYYAGDGQNKALVKPAIIEAMLKHARTLIGAKTSQNVQSPVPIALPAEPTQPAIPAVPDPSKGKRMYNEAQLSEAEIKLIQTQLQENGFVLSRIDGVWGPNTDLSIKGLQTAAGIDPDGHWGEATRKALFFDKVQKPISAERASTTPTDLRKANDPTTDGADRINAASIGQYALNTLTALSIAGQAASTGQVDLPFGLSFVTNLIPQPWGPIVTVGLSFGLAAYQQLKARGIIKTKVFEERSGISNTITVAPQDLPKRAGDFIKQIGAIFGPK